METKKPIFKARKWTSYILQGFIVVMFLQGTVQNLLETDMVVEAATSMGFPKSALFYFGLILLVITFLYAIPKTSILGAILITGWLGWAIATHVLHGDPIGNTLFLVLLG